MLFPIYSSMSPVVEGALGNFRPPADVVAEPKLIQLLERDFPFAIDGLYHPNVFGYQALPFVVVCHKFRFLQRYNNNLDFQTKTGEKSDA